MFILILKALIFLLKTQQKDVLANWIYKTKDIFYNFTGTQTELTIVCFSKMHLDNLSSV